MIDARAPGCWGGGAHASCSRARTAFVGALACACLLLLGAAARAEEPATADVEAPPDAAVIARILELEDQRETAGGELAGLLADDNAAVRARAARALGRIQDPVALEVLGASTGDSDATVRFEVAFALGQHFDRRAVPALLPMLEDVDVRVRETAVRALGRSADRNVTGALLELLGDEAAAVRGAVALACSDLADQNATVALVEQFARELDPQVRWRIAYCLSRLGDARARPALLAAVADPAMPAIRAWAAAGLRPLAREPDVVRALLRLCEDADTRVVVNMLRVVAAEPRGFAVADLAGLAKHGSFHVRAQLAETGGNLGGEGATLLLEGLSRDPSVSVRAAAVRSVSRLLGRHAMPLLAEAAGDSEPAVRAAASAGYAGVPGSAAANALELLLADESKLVKAAVVEAFGRRLREHVDPPDSVEAALAVDVLLRGLAIDDLAVRGTAVDELLAVLPAGGTAPVAEHPLLGFEPLIAALDSWQGRDTYELRETLARGLGERLSRARPLPGLLQASGLPAERAAPAGEDGVPESVRLAREQAMAVLERRLTDDFVSVRMAAAEAIAAISGGKPPAYDASPGTSDAADAPPPPQLLPAGATPRVLLKTARGDIVLELYADEAPRHVARFLQSVDSGLYDGLSFHRVVANFVVQGGDPLGHGWGDAGFSLRDEINPLPYLTGTVGMPKAGKDTGGCQLFITHSPQPRLDGRYTVFGTVKVGMEVVDAIEPGDRILSAMRLDSERKE